MRGIDGTQSAMFSYISPEQRVPKDHPLRQIRVLCDIALKALSGDFEVGHRPTVDSAREASAGLATADFLHHTKRTDVDGATELQPVVPLVCRAEHG
jgi:hypothetical protein